MIYEFDAEVWLYSAGAGGWHFITVPPDISEGLRVLRGPARNFGSMRVLAGIGETRWRTSVFPDKGRGAFILPVKLDVRRREGLAAGDRPRVTLEVEV